MSYLERIKTEFPENSQHKVLPKPTKAPSVSFVSSASRAFDEKGNPGLAVGDDIPGMKSEQDTQKLITSACQGLEISPTQFTTLCTEEDLELIAKGSFSVETLRAYARSFAEGIRDRRIAFHPTSQELIRHN